MDVQKILDLNWQPFRLGVRNFWGSLTEKEIDATRGDLVRLTVVIQDRTGESVESIINSLWRLLGSFDNDEDLGRSPPESSYLRKPASDL